MNALQKVRVQKKNAISYNGGPLQWMN